MPESTPIYEQTLAAIAAVQCWPSDLAAELAAPGLHISIDPHFLPVPCTWCDHDPVAWTCVRVHGDPGPVDPHRPLDQVDVCRDCAPRAIKQARTEQDPASDRDIQVEVMNQ